MPKKKRSHTTSDKAKIFAQVISQQQPDAVAPSDKDFAAMLKDIHISIGGRKERSNEQSNDKTSDGSKH